MTDTAHSYVVAQPDSLYQTNQLLRLRRHTDRLIAQRRMGLVTGPSGAGKTASSLDAARLAASLHDAKVVEIPTSPRPQPTFITSSMVAGVTGEPPRQTSYRRDDELVKLLREVKCIFVFDEAQDLGYPGLSQLKYLWERQRFAALLVGDIDLRKLAKASPQLWARLGHKDRFRLLSAAELRNVIAKMHPALAAVSDGSFKKLVDAFGYNLHSWENVAETIDDQAERLHLPAALEGKLLTAVIQDLT